MQITRREGGVLAEVVVGAALLVLIAWPVLNRGILGGAAATLERQLAMKIATNRMEEITSQIYRATCISATTTFATAADPIASPPIGYTPLTQPGTYSGPDCGTTTINCSPTNVSDSDRTFRQACLIENAPLSGWDQEVRRLKRVVVTITCAAGCRTPMPPIEVVTFVASL